MATEQTVQAVVGLTGFATESGGVRVVGDRIIRFDLPNEVGPEQMKLIRRDFEILAEKATQYPESLTELQNAVIKQDFVTAHRLVNEVGLTEEAVVAAGGGMWWAIAAAAVVIIAAAAFSSDGHPHHTPTPEHGPPPRTPIGDAGANG